MILLYLWILIGIPSVPQATICGLLENRNSLPIFVLLTFSPSPVGRLWVSFLWSAIPVRVLLLGICLFPELVCRQWRGISLTRIHVFHHGLSFFTLVYFYCWYFRFQVLLIHLPCCLSIRIFCYVLLVAIFYFKIVQFLLYLVVSICSCHLPPHLLVNFRFDVFEYIVLSVLFYSFSISF